MSFTHGVQDRRTSVLFLLGLFVLGGLLAAWRLPVALFPRVDFPRIVISLEAGDRPAERMTKEITVPVEEVVRAVPGVRGLRSTSSRGSSEISINFDWGADMISAMLQVQAAVTQVLPELPAGTSFEVRRMDPTVFPSIAYSLTSPRHSLIELRDLAYYQLRPLLSTVPGVRSVAVLGGAGSGVSRYDRTRAAGSARPHAGRRRQGAFRSQPRSGGRTSGGALQTLPGPR